MVEFYPLGTVPAEYPDWYTEPLVKAGIDPANSSVWILSADPDQTRLDSPSAYLLAMPPGYTLFKHGHPCFRFEVIIQGSIDIGDGQVAGVGDVFTAQPGELYGPHVAGPEGCTTIEFFSRLEAGYLMLYEGPDGEIQTADARKGELPPGGEPTPRGRALMSKLSGGVTPGSTGSV
jgi:hypothetical protein